MATRRVATVFGGSGFIGRYVVKRLAQQGYIVRVATRDPEGSLFLKTMGAVGQIVPLYASVTNEGMVHRAVEEAEVVVNLVGALTESGAASFQVVHVQGSECIAHRSAASGVGRLIQISAIGADPNSPSRYASTKGKAEQAVLAAFPRATILRPSLVFGLEDKFFNRFAAIAKLSPVMPVIAGETKMQPVFVGDVADAVMSAAALPAAEGQVFRTWRPPGVDVSGDSGIHPEDDEPAPAAGQRSDGDCPVAGVDSAVHAEQAIDSGPVADAVQGQRCVPRIARSDRSGDHPDAGRTDRSAIPEPLSTRRRPSPNDPNATAGIERL